MVLTLEIFGISRFLKRMRLSKTSTVFFVVAAVAVIAVVVVVVPLDSTRLPLALCTRVSLYFGRFLLLGCFIAYIIYTIYLLSVVCVVLCVFLYIHFPVRWHKITFFGKGWKYFPLYFFFAVWLNAVACKCMCFVWIKITSTCTHEHSMFISVLFLMIVVVVVSLLLPLSSHQSITKPYRQTNVI